MIRAEAARLARDGLARAGDRGGLDRLRAGDGGALRAIAHLPNGAVVLPGLDQGLDEEAWEAIGGRRARPRRRPSAIRAEAAARQLRRPPRATSCRSAKPPSCAAVPGSFRLRSDASGETTERLGRRGGARRRDEARGGREDRHRRRGERAGGGARRRRASPRGDRDARTPSPRLSRPTAALRAASRWSFGAGGSTSTIPPAGRSAARRPASSRGSSPRPRSAARRPRRCSRSSSIRSPPSAATPEETHRAARSLERAVLRGPRLKPGHGGAPPCARAPPRSEVRARAIDERDRQHLCGAHDLLARRHGRRPTIWPRVSRRRSRRSKRSRRRRARLPLATLVAAHLAALARPPAR